MAFILTGSPDSAQIAPLKTKTALRRPSAVSTVRWTSYAIAAGAVAVAGAPTAEAEIHYSGLINFKFQKDSRGSETHSFPLSQGVVLVGHRYVRGGVDNSATFLLDGAAVSSAFRTLGNTSFFPSSWAASVPRGAVIAQGPFGHFGVGLLQDYACEFPDFQGPGTYAVGFRFNTGHGRQYGWVRIKWGGCSWNGYIVKDYAWGDPGDQIKAGQTQLDEDEAQVAPRLPRAPRSLRSPIPKVHSGCSRLARSVCKPGADRVEGTNTALDLARSPGIRSRQSATPTSNPSGRWRG